jgi:hypothetical protein
MCGYSAYPRTIDFAKFREIADEVGALLMADIAHIAGLVAAGVHPSPFPHAHIVTTTTHKTLRGPRGGLIMTNDEELAKKIDRNVFPGTQGGPLMHIIAAKAVAFGEALRPEFKAYSAAGGQERPGAGRRADRATTASPAGGTDNHLMLVDLRPATRDLTGADAEKWLERRGSSPTRTASPTIRARRMVTSGLRLGTPAVTTRAALPVAMWSFTSTACWRAPHIVPGMRLVHRREAWRLSWPTDRESFSRSNDASRWTWLRQTARARGSSSRASAFSTIASRTSSRTSGASVTASRCITRFAYACRPACSPGGGGCL